LTPVYQDLFFEKGKDNSQQRGNCLSAVVASLLDLPLKAVPNFVEIDTLGGPNWWWHMWKYLELMNKELVMINPRNPPAGKYYTLAGLSKRATEYAPIHHIVIFKDGKLIHDPVPGGDGNYTYDNGWYLQDSGGRY
jgi:hypothetical protein